MTELAHVLTVAYFANRLEGGPVFNSGEPERPVGACSEQLQKKLARLGYDVGKIDGTLGADAAAAGHAKEAGDACGCLVDGGAVAAVADQMPRRGRRARGRSPAARGLISDHAAASPG